jgi:mono/diheme cytochrome c family protein
MNSVTLPEGPGKELVAAHCALCHNLEKVVSSKRSKADWEATTINMEQRGMKATPDEMQTMISYLQANFSAAAPAGFQFEERSMHTGKEIFTQKCLQCHSVLPDQVQFGPSLYGEMRMPQPKLTDAQVRTILRDGKGKMPPAKDLSKEDMDNLLAYLRSL